jgi:hypothetical protein
MKNITTRLAFRALFAIVMQTEVHAQTTPWMSRPIGSVTDTSHGTITNSGPTQFVINKNQWCKLYDYPAADGCVLPQPAATHCAPGHEQACQQRDNGASPYQGSGR